jgi:hypothetical protein
LPWSRAWDRSERPVPQDLLSSANFDHWFPTFIGDLLMWIFDFQWILSDFLTFLSMLRAYLTASPWFLLVALFWKRGWCSFETCLVSSFQRWVTVSHWSIRMGSPHIFLAHWQFSFGYTAVPRNIFPVSLDKKMGSQEMGRSSYPVAVRSFSLLPLLRLQRRIPPDGS